MSPRKRQQADCSTSSHPRSFSKRTSPRSTETFARYWRPVKRSCIGKEIARPARPLVLQQVTDLPIVAFAVAAGAVHPRQQEAARVKVLQRLLHVLDRREGVHEVIIEARAPALNRRDAITIARARARGTVSTDLRYEHRRKSEDPGLWAADVVAR